MYDVVITADDKEGLIEKVMAPDDKEFSNKRANFKCLKHGDKVKIVVEAKDAVALRSVLNTISKVLDTFEKTNAVIEDLK